MWDNAAITTAGAALIAQAVGENTITISAAAAGTGTATDLQSLTSLSNQKHSMSIVGVEKSENNIKIQLQLTSIGNTQAYTLNQIGVWGSMGGQAALLAVYQNADGILIPTESDMPDFVFTFYANITIDNQTNITVSLDTSALVSSADLENKTKELIMADETYMPMFPIPPDVVFDGTQSTDVTLNIYGNQMATVITGYIKYAGSESIGTISDNFMGNIIRKELRYFDGDWHREGYGNNFYIDDSNTLKISLNSFYRYVQFMIALSRPATKNEMPADDCLDISSVEAAEQYTVSLSGLELFKSVYGFDASIYGIITLHGITKNECIKPHAKFKPGYCPTTLQHIQNSHTKLGIHFINLETAEFNGIMEQIEVQISPDGTIETINAEEIFEQYENLYSDSIIEYCELTIKFDFPIA